MADQNATIVIDAEIAEALKGLGDVSSGLEQVSGASDENAKKAQQAARAQALLQTELVEVQRALRSARSAYQQAGGGSSRFKQETLANIGALGQQEAALKNQVRALRGSARGSGLANNAVMELARGIGDARYGIQGMGNNIEQLVSQFGMLRTQTGSTKGALAAMGSALTGPVGITVAISAAIAILPTLIDWLGDTGDKAEETAERIKAASASVLDFQLSAGTITIKDEQQGENALARLRGRRRVWEAEVEMAKRRLSKLRAENTTAGGLSGPRPLADTPEIKAVERDLEQFQRQVDTAEQGISDIEEQLKRFETSSSLFGMLAPTSADQKDLIGPLAEVVRELDEGMRKLDFDEVYGKLVGPMERARAEAALLDRALTDLAAVPESEHRRDDYAFAYGKRLAEKRELIAEYEREIREMDEAARRAAELAEQKRRLAEEARKLAAAVKSVSDELGRGVEIDLADDLRAAAEEYRAARTAAVDAILKGGSGPRSVDVPDAPDAPETDLDPSAFVTYADVVEQSMSRVVDALASGAAAGDSIENIGRAMASSLGQLAVETGTLLLLQAAGVQSLITGLTNPLAMAAAGTALVVGGMATLSAYGQAVDRATGSGGSAGRAASDRRLTAPSYGRDPFGQIEREANRFELVVHEKGMDSIIDRVEVRQSRRSGRAGGDRA